MDNPAPLISVIIPTFSAAEKLRRTLDSVLNQQRDLFEVIVTDGGSSDGTSKLLSEYGDSIRTISEPDRGVYDAMNKGIAMARGQYLYFLGAGDTLRPGVLETVAEKLPKSGLVLLYGDVFLCGEGRRAGGEFSVSDFCRMRNVYHQAIFYSRDIFDRLGPYDLRYKLRADNAINLRAWGDPTICKQYVDIIIADYEGGGLSDTIADVDFKRDFPAFVQRSFGFWHYALYTIASIKYRMVEKKKQKG